MEKLACNFCKVQWYFIVVSNIWISIAIITIPGLADVWHEKRSASDLHLMFYILDRANHPTNLWPSNICGKTTCSGKINTEISSKQADKKENHFTLSSCKKVMVYESLQWRGLIKLSNQAFGMWHSCLLPFLKVV